MEKKIKVIKGTIIKTIPASLQANYVANGWSILKEMPTPRIKEYK